MQEQLLSEFINSITSLAQFQQLYLSQKGDPVRALARAHVFVALRRLDGQYKGLAIQFLYEANLLGNHVTEDQGRLPPVIALNGADLTGMLLPKANLAWSHFVAADLSRADLRHAYLTCTNLGAVDLIDARLAGANLCQANLLLADLTGADLDGADLTGAVVSRRQLDQAHVTDTTILPRL